MRKESTIDKGTSLETTELTQSELEVLNLIFDSGEEVLAESLLSRSPQQREKVVNRSPMTKQRKRLTDHGKTNRAQVDVAMHSITLMGSAECDYT